MKQKKKGWTHPDHWVVAMVGTMCQALAAACVVLAFLVTPTFHDREAKSYKLSNMDVKCEIEFCYDSKVTLPDDAFKKAVRPHVFHVHKNEPGWLSIARILMAVGAGTNLLSLALLVLIFWPMVLAGRVLNCLLHICRFVDFFGAPSKFFGAFIILKHISDINQSYACWKFQGILSLEPLPIGMVLFSYILQTLCFVCSTLATDKGARGQDTHLQILETEHMFGDDEDVDDDKASRVSYNPIDKKRSSRVLAEVESHYSRNESIV